MQNLENISDGAKEVQTWLLALSEVLEVLSEDA